jgi:alkylation response protein AidB-like acyl-CoA dehydrogenase
MLVSN